MASVDGVTAQVRRIAILVTSLDAAAGRQLLTAMPGPLARDVRKAMASLTSIDPEERRRVLADFHNRAFSTSTSTSTSASRSDSAAAPAAAADRPGSPNAAVNASNATARDSGATVGMPSASDHVDALSAPGGDVEGTPGYQGSGDSNRTWQRFDVPTLIDLLRGERATVIAVVLSQLQPQQAVGLLEQLPRQQQRTIIENLSRLGDIDPEAMQAIDDHLASRIADYGHRRASETESVSRMQNLLAAASPELRGHWQEIIAQTDQQLAGRLGLTARAISSASQGEKSSVATPIPASAAGHAAPSLVELLGSEAVARADTPFEPPADEIIDDEPHVLPFQVATSSTVRRSEPAGGSRTGTAGTTSPQAASGQAASARAASADAAKGEIRTLDQILELPPHDIAQVLSAADGEVILLALAGASPSFMQRFTPLLEKSDARALHAQLRRLGAINLQDVDEAQRRLCELATQVVHSSRPGRRQDSAVRSAA